MTHHTLVLTREPSKQVSHQFARVNLIFYFGTFLGSRCEIPPNLCTSIFMTMFGAIAFAFGSRVTRWVTAPLLLLAIVALCLQLHEQQ